VRNTEQDECACARHPGRSGAVFVDHSCALIPVSFDLT
jgi:hypothetical protein